MQFSTVSKEKVWDEEREIYLFAPGDERVMLYPNVTVMGALAAASSPGMRFIESASKPPTVVSRPLTKMAITIILPTVKSPWVRRTMTIQLTPVRII